MLFMCSKFDAQVFLQPQPSPHRGHSGLPLEEDVKCAYCKLIGQVRANVCILDTAQRVCHNTVYICVVQFVRVLCS